MFDRKDENLADGVSFDQHKLKVTKKIIRVKSLEICFLIKLFGLRSLGK